ncbi:Wzz/FepE/Etk N-terminal domain-containing protein [Halobacillus litoralis]|uniref:YveK family protein n=1 Tax=Halobacillus litoralis TaxID=45668 RepID=UPI001CFF2BF3|nr:Wzz/FepE/Etk N-terminal domain-containing protein [Halobacillus litoralis]WLR49124.1 Wzz/FepE/Etk N-terminal domain-containing protein [Halobacillus litoralis]
MRKKTLVYDDYMSKDINIKEYFDVLRDRFWLIFIITIIMGALGYGYSQMNNTSLYQTSTRIILGSSEQDMDMNTLMVMIKDPIIMSEVQKTIGMEGSPEGLANRIEVSRIDESQVVLISVTDTDPERAAQIANKTASVYKSKIVDLLNYEQVQLLSKAGINPISISGNQNRPIYIAILLGLITGVGLAYLMDSIDGAVKSRKEIEDILDLPVLGEISYVNRRNSVTKKAKKGSNNMEVRGESVGIKQN